MCYSAASSMTGWLLAVILAAFIWYRNQLYDRVLAAFILALGLIQLIEYGVWTSIEQNKISSGVTFNSDIYGRLLFLTLAIQCFIINLGVYCYVSSVRLAGGVGQVVRTLALFMFSLFAIVLALSIFYLMFYGSFSAKEGTSSHIEWAINGDAIPLTVGVFYLIGIFVPLLILFMNSEGTDIGPIILLLYGILSAVYVAYTFSRLAFSSMWCYLAIGFAFLVWMLGIIPGGIQC